MLQAIPHKQTEYFFLCLQLKNKKQLSWLNNNFLKSLINKINNNIINFGSTQMDFVFSSSYFTISHLTRQHIYSSKWSVIQLDCKHFPIFYKVIGTIPKRKKKKLAIEYRHLSSFLTNIGTFRRTSTTVRFLVIVQLLVFIHPYFR